MIEHNDLETPSDPGPSSDGRGSETHIKTQNGSGRNGKGNGNGNGSSAPVAELPPAPEVKALPPAPEDAPPAHPVPKKRRSRAWIWLLIIAALGWVGYRAYRSREEQREAAQAAQARRMANRPVSVAVATARRMDFPIYLRGLGTVDAYNTVNL